MEESYRSRNCRWVAALGLGTNCLAGCNIVASYWLWASPGRGLQRGNGRRAGWRRPAPGLCREGHRACPVLKQADQRLVAVPSISRCSSRAGVRRRRGHAGRIPGWPAIIIPRLVGRPSSPPNLPQHPIYQPVSALLSFVVRLVSFARRYLPTSR